MNNNPRMHRIVEITSWLTVFNKCKGQLLMYECMEWIWKERRVHREPIRIHEQHENMSANTMTIQDRRKWEGQ